MITHVYNPRWNNLEKTSLDCMVRNTDFTKDLPYTALDDGTNEEHARIFRDCVAGRYGEIADPDPSRIKQRTASPSAEFVLPSKWPEILEFIREVNIENYNNSPRAIVLIWGSMLQEILKTVILYALKQQERETATFKVGKNGCAKPFHKLTFEELIRGAENEGYIDKAVSSHMTIIRDVRNVCAHQWKLTEENPEVAEACKDLFILREAYFPEYTRSDWHSLIKLVFTQASCMIALYLANRQNALASDDPPPPHVHIALATKL